jgi:starch phosphorylase
MSPKKISAAKPSGPVDPLEEAVFRHARHSLALSTARLSPEQALLALSLAVRDRVTDRMLDTDARHATRAGKHVSYLSMEFLMGRSLRNNIINLGLESECAELLGRQGIAMGDLEEIEPDAALGNGGLGRLAACYLDSMATLDLPGTGYGINYEYGLFRQRITDGEQRELPDQWMEAGTPWEIAHPDEALFIPLYGRVEDGTDRHGSYNPMWMDWMLIKGLPHDMPVVGFGGGTVLKLRLFSAKASHEFDMRIFNEGDFFRAVEQKIASETVSKVLYPTDMFESGRELRLVQEYFLVACALRDILRRFALLKKDFTELPRYAAIQMNDTHPSLAVAELMRVLVDENGLPWEAAWDITTNTLAYTNHTLMPEALETWPVNLLEKVLPRHLQIIYEINRRFLDNVELRWPGDEKRAAGLSVIGETGRKHVRMANLAIIGSHSTNGVAPLHSGLITTRLVPDFYALWPERFGNVTNGVTPRRWLLSANPGLSRVITEAIGDKWPVETDGLKALENFAADGAFLQKIRRVKRENKEALAKIIHETIGLDVNPAALFDFQVKRIHEYKRQLLHLMAVAHDYLRIVDDGITPAAPRVHLFAGKAAPGYLIARRTIHLINQVARIVNADPRAAEWLRVVFLPDYRVSLAERIIPAADLSEQISMAGTEASGTSNMKLAINGALTLGTIDGANIQIRDCAGAENFFAFGLSTDEIAQIHAHGGYNCRHALASSAAASRVMAAFACGRFSPGNPSSTSWVWELLVDHGDQYLHLADFDDYLRARAAAEAAWLDQDAWTRMSLLNTARMGYFSSDRAIREYAKNIWGMEQSR